MTPYIIKACSKRDGSYDEQSIANYFTRQELVNIAWGCAVLKEYPPELMAFLYTGVLGRGDNANPEYLSALYNDGGLPQESISSFFYVRPRKHNMARWRLNFIPLCLIVFSFTLPLYFV
jgi:hypothetical protein